MLIIVGRIVSGVGLLVFGWGVVVLVVFCLLKGVDVFVVLVGEIVWLRGFFGYNWYVICKLFCWFWFCW